MSSKTLSLLLALPLVSAACTTPVHEAGTSFLTHWQDVPVPRGFEPAEVVATKAALQVGSFRHGELRYEGIGNVEAIQAYYLERLPDHGWVIDLAGEGWKKGPCHLTVNVSLVPKESYDSFQRVRVDLLMRSERAPIPSQ